MSDLFKEKASDWDMNEMVKNLSTGIGTTILKQLDLNDSMQIMDFGAGTGLISSHIAPAVNKITAVDISESMLEQLAAKPELKDKVETVCHDITLKSLDKTFDVIVSAMAMHHVKDTDQMLSSFAKHLKPGGKVALADLDKEDGTFHPEDIEGVYHHGFDRDELAEKLEQQGFTGIEFTTAHVVNKPEQSYPVFLVTAAKA